MSRASTLALLGGEPAVPPGMVKPWPPVDDLDEKYVLESLRGANHAFGPNCAALEREFAAWNGNRFAVTTNSGTAALHMGVAACDCGPGDEVIVPAYSWSSSATCILHHNAIPVFVDIAFDTMNLDPDRIEAAVTPRTKAILVVHLHGLAMDMDRVMAIARKHGLKVIEDACQAHGATFKGRKVGTFGDCAAFSLNQNKNLCSGEGGLFVTDDEELLNKARMLWSFGETRTPVESRDYHAYALGWMYRNNDLTAAFGRAQLTKLDRHLAWQRENGGLLLEELRDVPNLILPAVPEGHNHTWYNFILRFDVEALGHARDARAFRDRIVRALQAEGVDTGIWQTFILPAMTVFQAQNAYGKGCPWSCLHLHEVVSPARYAAPVRYAPEDYPVAQRHCDTHTCILTPLRCPNTPETVKRTALGIRKVMENIRQLEQLA
jgi:perosamine synthetase